MLQQGQSPGRYAAMLRDILRKMSRDDSNVRIKSLEQVLKLGQELVQKEAGGSPSSMAAHPQQQMSSSSPPSRRMPPTNLNSAFSSEGPSRLQAQQHVARSYAMQSQSQSRSMMGAGEGGQQPPKVIGRASRAPGILPDRTEKKSGRVS